MDEERVFTKSEPVDFENLHSEFLNLRIGEEIPRLAIKEIRKVINKSKNDNLSGVDYKYFIESIDGKILTVNSWALWNKIRSALQEAGKIKAVLELKHSGVEEYSVKAI